jgi:hypothetical protein
MFAGKENAKDILQHCPEVRLKSKNTHNSRPLQSTKLPMKVHYNYQVAIGFLLHSTTLPTLKPFGPRTSEKKKVPKEQLHKQLSLMYVTF